MRLLRMRLGTDISTKSGLQGKEWRFCVKKDQREKALWGNEVHNNGVGMIGQTIGSILV